MPRVASPNHAFPRLALAIGLLLALAACSPAGSPSPSATGATYAGWPEGGQVVTNGDLIPSVFSSELAVGDNRVMVALHDQSGVSLANPEMTATLAFYNLASSVDTAVSQTDGTFRWLIPDAKGIFIGPGTFSQAGTWGLEVTTHIAGQSDLTARTLFSVGETTRTPAIGAAAPPSDTPTATDANGLLLISTDPNPDPDFYLLSIKDAIAAGKPFVVVFATPAFCTSGVCGPALDLVRQVADPYKAQVNFIHVEPYQLELVDGHAQPVVDALGQPQTVRAVIDWNLPTEPYIFVVDANGKVAAKFEGSAYPDELTAALDALLP